jgi:CubicO group peptidase (beta-lactamase class C family)
MLLERGRSGEAEILSKESFAAMLPRPLKLAAGERERSWGVACRFLGGNGLSPEAFGHEAASGAVLRIDPMNNLVVVVARDEVGTSNEEYERYLGSLLRTVTTMLSPSTENRHE